MQRIGWFGAAAAAVVLIVAAAVFGLRGTAPPKPATTPAPPALAGLLPGDAKKPVRVLQHPAPGAGQGLSLDTAEYGAGGRLALSGHAAPGARVNVYVGDKPLGTATADAAGSWSLNTPYREPTGGAELRLDELAADGSVARRIAAPLAAPGAAVAEAGGNYTVQRGNSLWLIARQVYGQGTRHTALHG